MRRLIDFVKDVAEDNRIPVQNRMVLGALLVYVMTPIDIIPDFIPIIGWLDEALVTVLILDYVFNSADSEIILQHYPWNKKSFFKMKSYAERLSWLVPQTVKRILFRHAFQAQMSRPSKREELPESSSST